MDQSSLVVIKDDVGLETLLKMYETKRRICSEEIALDTMIRSACELDSGYVTHQKRFLVKLEIFKANFDPFLGGNQCQWTRE